MNVIEISDSSDDEIVFFSVAKGDEKKAKVYDEEVIFCGIRKASTSRTDDAQSLKQLERLKDVNIISRKVETKAREDPDVEFLGIGKTSNQALTLPSARSSSDSVNININSEKSLENTNVTINIDAENSKKKVQLTFLGPSNNANNYKTIWNDPSTANNNRIQNNPLQNNNNNIKSNRPPPSNDNRVRNNPFVQNNNNSNNKQNNIRNSVVLNNPATTSNTKTPSSNHSVISTPQVINVPSANISSVKPAADQSTKCTNQNPTSSCLTLLHRDINLLNSRTRSQKTNPNTLKKDLRPRIGHPMAYSTPVQRPVENAIPSSLQQTPPGRNEQPLSMKSCYDNVVNQVIMSTLGEPVFKMNESSNVEEALPRSKEVKQKAKEKAKQTVSKLREKNKQDVSKTREKTKKDEPKTKDKTKQDVSKSKETEPVASTSSIQKKKHFSSPQQSSSDSSDSSSDVEDDVSLSDSSSCKGSEAKPLITKSQLDALFNKFVKGYSKANLCKTGKKLMGKIRKLYQSSDNATRNEEFILLLKEVTCKIESKSANDHLDIIKKVFQNLRKDSPSNQKNIMKLEKVLCEINKKIKKFEETEINSDDDENENIYVKLDKYRKRAVEIYSKLCELNLVPADAERPTLRNVTFHGRAPGEYSKSTSMQSLVTRVSRALEKYYNKSRKFPDFQDVCILMRKLNIEGGFKFKSVSLQHLARSLFEEFGDMLQKRRLYDDYKICNEYLDTDDDDPYYSDPILAAKLDQNRKHKRKENDVLQKFTLKQVKLKESGFEDSGSLSSSDSDLDNEVRHEGSKYSKSRESSDGSSSDDSDNSVSVERKKKRLYSDSESSSDNSSDESTKEKIRRVKKLKHRKTSLQHKNTELDDSKNIRKRCKSFDIDSESDKSSKGKKRRTDNPRQSSIEAPCQIPTAETHISPFKESQKSSNSESHQKTSLQPLQSTRGELLQSQNDEPQPSSTNRTQQSLIDVPYQNPSDKRVMDEPHRISTNGVADDSVIDDEISSIISYKNASTVVMDEEVAKKRDCQVVVQSNDGKSEDNIPVIEDDLVIIEEENNMTQVEGSSGFMIVNEIEVIQNETNEQTENSIITIDESKQCASVSSSANTSGLLITNVTSCPESFPFQEEIPVAVIPTVDLLSDEDEAPPPSVHRNVLSPDDVLKLIPIIFGREQ